MKTIRKQEEKIDIVDLSLRVKYWKKFNKCKAKILARYSELKDAAEYIFISEVSLSSRLKIEKVNLERKAWCKGNKIYIGEIVLMQNEDDLTKVILHELLHINYPYYTVRRHIVGGANRTLISVEIPPRSCRIGTCRRFSAG